MSTKTFKAAPFYIRVLQYIADHAIILLFLYILKTNVQFTNEGQYDAYGILFYLTYYSITTWWFKGTIGMKMLNLSLVGNNIEKPVKFGDCVLRATCMVGNFIILQIGHLWMLFRKDRKTLIDIASKTRVGYVMNNINPNE